MESFEESVSAIRIGSTWKSTSSKRHILTDHLIMDALPTFLNPIILDAGVSSGCTSLETLDLLNGNYARYYATDIYFDLPFRISKNVTFFYHPLSLACIMRISDWFIVYEDLQSAYFPLGHFARYLLADAPKYDLMDTSFVSMLHPNLKRRAMNDSRVIIEQYNIFDIWNHEPVDIVKVANVLNRQYFSDEEIRIAIANLKNAMQPAGKLIITDNRALEKVTMFTKKVTGKLIIEKELNGGADISDIVISV